MQIADLIGVLLLLGLTLRVADLAQSLLDHGVVHVLLATLILALQNLSIDHSFDTFRQVFQNW